MAGPGPGHRPGLAGGRGTPSSMRQARGHRGGGAVGPARCGSHPQLRRAGRLVGDTVLQNRDHAVDADCVANRRGDHHPGADIDAAQDRFAGLRRLGIDEISYKRHHKYLTVVVDHDTGRLVWAKPGRDKATLASFFDQLGPERSALITHVSADGAEWISTVVAKQCPQAVRCADPFHVVQWATEALDEVRRQAWNLARGAVTRRRAGRSTGHAKALKGARYALWKNPENLTGRQQAKLAWIAKTDPRLHRAYLLKEGLRLVFSLDRPNQFPQGSDVSAGTYKSTECGYRLQVQSTQHLPPCPSCHNGFGRR